MCRLRKEYYSIPSIEIPETLSYDDEEEDSESLSESQHPLDDRVIEEDEVLESDSREEKEASESSRKASEQEPQVIEVPK